MQTISQLLDGTLLMVLPLFGITIAAYSVWRVLSGRHPVNPVLLAAGLLTIPYSHHAFARASLDHLAQAIHPMLIGVFAITISLTRVRAAAVAGIICAISILLLPLHPLYERWQHGDWVSAQIGPDVLVVDPSIAARAALFSELLAAYAPEGREYVAEPMICGAYSIFDRRAAVWDTYALFPADAGVQQWEIERIRAEHPALIIIDRGLNGRGADAYSHTHPLVYDYIVRNFMPIHPDFVSPEWHFELYVPADSGK